MICGDQSPVMAFTDRCNLRHLLSGDTIINYLIGISLSNEFFPGHCF